MIDTCPHCDQELNLSEAQLAKVKAALAKLPAGNLLKLGCPHCQKPFELEADGTLPGTEPVHEEVESGAPLPPRENKAKINVKGVDAGMMLPLSQDAVIQISNSHGQCWDSSFSTFKKNDEKKFKAK